MENLYWTIEGVHAPIVATAIHAGHAVRPELLPKMALSEEERLREEDPFTDRFTAPAKGRIVATHSRFEVDLNRPREGAVYQKPEDAWGLQVWKTPLSAAELAQSLAIYDAFYSQMRHFFDAVHAAHGKFVVLDIHSYNHHRKGPTAPFDDPEENPDINIGTETNPFLERWRDLIDASMETMRNFDYFGRHIDVRENVKFGGGYFAEWIHQNYAPHACVISVEFKKFFMDEWSGTADEKQLERLTEMMAQLLPTIETELEKVQS